MKRLRADAEAVLRAAIAAASPAPLVTRALSGRPGPARAHVLAVGKAAVPMARAALAAWQGRIAAALVIAPAAEDAPWPEPPPVVQVAEHPVPGAGSLRAGLLTRTFLEPLAEGDVLLVLLSGGASSLLTLPAPGLSLDDLARTTGALLAAGADIAQLNCVRKHLDLVKGGRLARLAAPAHVLCLALSDVPGDDPAVIGSGPFAPDPTTFADARAVLATLGVERRVPAAVRAHLARGAGESLKPEDGVFERVETQVIASNRTARLAAADCAARRGYAVETQEDTYAGEAAALAAALPLGIAPGSAWIAGGETTVTVRGGGRGGRNQELALASALRIAGDGGVVVACAGTDGTDGNSPAAGGIVDGSTVERLRAHGIDAARALAGNDSYTALSAVGDAWVTGPTGTNVMDLVVVLRGQG